MVIQSASVQPLKLNNELTPLFSLIALILLIALFNIPIMLTLWHYSFDDGTYSHAYLIPFIVIYLYFYLYEEKALEFRQNYSLLASIWLILSAYLLFVTTTAQISLGYWLATLLLLCTSINLLFKTNFKVLFPAFYFIFLIPLWGLLTIPLQDLSVMAVNIIMGFTSIPVFVENQFVHIPSGVFEIAGGCSGLRYLLTSLAISSLYIFLYLRTTKSIVLFAFAAILGALLTNWIRIALLIIIGHQTEMTSSLMDDHNTFGWYLYLPFMFLLFKFGGYLTGKEDVKERQTKKYAIANSPQISLSGLLLVVLIISSTTIKQNFIDNQPSSELITAVKVQPTVYYYSTVAVKENNNSTTSLIYSFNGGDLDGKPTFFDNNLIPEGWRVVGNSATEQQQVFKIFNGVKYAELAVNYEINGKYFGNNKAFKIARLKNALIGLGATKLYWNFKMRDEGKS